MLQINSTKLAVGVLNALVEKDGLDLDIMEGLYTAIMLLDPQPEEDFYEAVRSAYETTGASLADLEKLIAETESKADES